MKNNTMQYLNPREREVIARLSYEKITVITQEQFDKLFGYPKSVREKTFYRLSKKGILKRIKNGVYLYSPLEAGPAGSNINEFLIPPLFFPKKNYYVGYSTMYNYYGFTDQLFQTMYILNTSMQKEKVVGNVRFRMVKVSAKRLYGIETIRIKDTDVIVSDREKTLLDLFYFPEPVGGLRKAFEILKTDVLAGKTDISKLIKYALKSSNTAIMKRIGITLEGSGVPEDKLNPLLSAIKKSSLINLYPSSSRKGRINKKWQVIENVA